MSKMRSLVYVTKNTSITIINRKTLRVIKKVFKLIVQHSIHP